MSQISAMDFSTLCFWAARAGMPGVVHQYGMAPGAQSGSYSRHLDRVLGLGRAKRDWYEVKTVGNPKGGLERRPLKIFMKPPHEALQAELD
eukprot:10522700-Alexandrium_andersonii.AAC.1